MVTSDTIHGLPGPPQPKAHRDPREPHHAPRRRFPRAHELRRVLTRGVLERAAAEASRPVDRAAPPRRPAAEDLLIFKVLFDRDKDWRDVEELIYATSGELDVAYAKGWLERILGGRDARHRRLGEVLDRYA